MSTSAVSSSSIYQELQSFYQNRKADLSQLGSDLQSGNLSAAQQDFSALVALGQSGPFATSEPFAKSGKDQTFAAIGQALQSGDLAGAKAAFATLTNTATPVTASPAAVVNLSGVHHIPEPPVSGTSSIYQQLQAYEQSKKADIAQLGQDLQSGNLSAAQQDYNALAALGQTGPSKNGQTFQRTDRSTDFAAIGQALQSGDLAGAQSAYANLESTYGRTPVAQPPIIKVPPTPAPPIAQPPVAQPPILQVPPIAQPPIIKVPPVSVGPAPVTPPLSTNSTGSGVPEIVIHLGSGSSGAQISIDSNHGQSAREANELTINLNPQSNYELILNLLNSNSTTSSGNAVSVSA